ncbi:MAG: 30S ribosomal protein S27e [Candidatus Aenigmatarchaeota archaeon]|nr:30S ribosomal protein S27e [Candidatus Aenigmarchaeota archaeon]
MRSVRRPTSKFLKVVCGKCKNEQTIFNKPSSTVKCLVCGAELAETTGGRGRLKAKVLSVMD